MLDELQLDSEGRLRPVGTTYLNWTVAGALDDPDSGCERLYQLLTVDPQWWRIVIVDLQNCHGTSLVDVYGLPRRTAVSLDELERRTERGEPVEIVHLGRLFDDMYDGTESALAAHAGPLNLWELLAGCFKRVHLRLTVPELSHPAAELIVTGSVADSTRSETA